MEISIDPVWAEIEPAREATRRFLRSQELAEELVDSLTMVIGELLENGIKYGYFPDDTSRVSVNLSLEGDHILIDVVHPVDEGAYPNLLNLDKTIQWIRGYQDPFEAYTEKLKQVGAKSFEDRSSGLGLVRIAYEGQAILDFFVNENGNLTVSAVSSLAKGGPIGRA